MTLNRKHKKQLIGGLIGVFLLFLTLTVKYFFANSSDTKTLKNGDSTKSLIVQRPEIISTDSSNQTVNQVNQVNQNKGDVNNEFISGNKVINQNTVVNKETTKPLRRSPSKNDISRIKTIPSDYLVVLNYSYMDKECQNFGELLSQTLKELNYNYQISIYGQLSTNTYDPRFEIRVDDQNRKAEIFVYVLREN